MRRILLGFLAIMGVSAIASDASAQNISDPFFAYYSFYLPRQQAQALQQGPEATINAVTANRQLYAATNRNGMFDPGSNGSTALDSDDFALNSGKIRRSVSSSGGSFGVHGGNLNGLGPQGFYNRTGGYYRNIKSGRGKNANVSPVRGRGYSGGYAGMGTGLPGPR